VIVRSVGGIFESMTRLLIPARRGICADSDLLPAGRV